MRKFLFFSLFLALLSSCGMSKKDERISRLASEIEEKDERISELEEELGELQEKLDNINSSASDAQSYIDDDDMENTSSSVDDIESESEY